MSMIFWIVVASLAVGVGAILARALLRGNVGETPPAAYDLQVYRDQLKEVDRDLARGVMSAEEAEKIRTEVSRRILSADTALRSHDTASGASRGGLPVLALVLLAGALGGSVMLYSQIGAPGLGDLPMKARLAASEAARAERLDQAAAEAIAPALPPARTPAPEYAELMEKLRQTVKDRPDDLRGLGLLVRNEASFGNVVAAYQAQAQLVEVKGAEATAHDHGLLADLMIAAAGGYVSNEAETALRTSLAKDPAHPTSRYYLGVYLLQIDRPDAAFRTWEGLLRESQPDAPWVPPIRAQIEDVAWRAGVEYKLPPLPDAEPSIPARGPTPEEIEAAENMTAEERDDMIRGMVRNLADRVENEAVAPADWARLISAYGVLGEEKLAASTWEDAQKTFWDAPDALDFIRQAAIRAGVAE